MMDSLREMSRGPYVALASEVIYLLTKWSHINPLSGRLLLNWSSM